MTRMRNQNQHNDKIAHSTRSHEGPWERVKAQEIGLIARSGLHKLTLLAAPYILWIGPDFARRRV